PHRARATRAVHRRVLSIVWPPGVGCRSVAAAAAEATGGIGPGLRCHIVALRGSSRGLPSPGRRNPMNSTLLIALSLLVLLAWAAVASNRRVRRRNRVRTAWADIDVQLARRHDLVPALVAATKAYAGHERAVLEAVTGLRARALAQDSRPGLAAV